MKLDSIGYEVEKSEGMRTKGFGMIANAHSFRILSSGLYSNKVKAVIRELSTNAYDAHIAANKKDEPFEVKLPNSLDRTFRVKDNGTGMSPKEVENLYTTYFYSSKTNSNDQVGCFGLGSKSPFSYTDNFVVETRWEGKKHSYSCHINEKGSPAISKLGVSNTNEPNGLDIQVDVKPADINAFNNEALQVLRFFEPSPKILGSNMPLITTEWAHKTDKFGLAKPNTSLPSNIILMGNVSYPIPPSVDKCSLLNNVTGLALFMNIGEVTPTASRESIELNDATVKILSERLKLVKDHLTKEIHDGIANAKSPINAVVSLKDKFSRFHNLFYGDQLKYKNIVIKSSYNYHLEIKLDHLKLKYYSVDNTLTSSKGSNIESNTTPIIIDNYYKGIPREKIKHWMRTNNYTSCIYLKDVILSDIDDIGILDDATSAADLDNPPRQKKNTPLVSDVFIHYCSGGGFQVRKFDPLAICKLYILKKGRNFLLNGKEVSSDDLKNLILSIRDFDSTFDVALIKSSMEDKLKLAGWKSLDQFLIGIAKSIDQKTLIDFFVTKELSGRTDIISNIISSKYTMLDRSSIKYKTYNFISKYSDEKKVSPVLADKMKIYAKYPLLKHIEYSTPANLVNQYMEQINELERLSNSVVGSQNTVSV